MPRHCAPEFFSQYASQPHAQRNIAATTVTAPLEKIQIDHRQDGIPFVLQNIPEMHVAMHNAARQRIQSLRRCEPQALTTFEEFPVLAFRTRFTPAGKNASMRAALG